MEKITLICEVCLQPFLRSKRKILDNKKRGKEHTFCSTKCYQVFHGRPTIKCTNCGINTKNNKFCSRSCAATYNNKIPKKKRTLYCLDCNKPIISKRKFCEECWSKRIIKVNEATLKDVVTTAGSHSSYKSIVGEHARKLARHLGKLEKCAICSYSLHVECCHIKPISKFSIDTLISIVNHPDNLIGLCRNHHWELDHGMLELAFLTGLEPVVFRVKV